MIRLAYKNFKEDKKKFLLIILLTLVSLLTIFIISVHNTINNYIDKSILNHIDYRTYFVDYSDNMTEKEAIHKIENIDHIVEVYSAKYTSFNIDLDRIGSIKTGGKIHLLGSTFGKNIDIIEGTRPQNKYDIVCPAIFYKEGEPNKEIDSSDFTTLKTNTKIDAHFGIMPKGDIIAEKWLTDDITLNIVGIYRNNPADIDENTCYVKRELIEELYTKSNANIDTSTSKTSLLIEIDDIENIDYVKKELKELDMYYASKVVLKTGFITIINLTSVALVLTVLTFLYFFVRNIIQKEILNYQETLKLYRAVGYTKNDIVKILTFKNLFSVLWSFIISTSIICAVEFYINKLLINKPFIFMKTEILISKLSLFLIYIFIVVLFIIMINRIKKNSKTKDILGGY